MKPFHLLVHTALVLSFAASASAQERVDGYRPAREVLAVAPDLRGEFAAPPVEDTLVLEVEGETVEIELPPAGAPIGEGTTTVDVTVTGLAGERYDAPQPGKVVELSVLRPPHDVVERLIAVTGEDGVARFRVAATDGLQAFARMLHDGKETFAPTGLNLRPDDAHTLAIQHMPIVTDSSSVFASRIVTIVELWEDFLVFTQVFHLATDQPVIFEAGGEGRDAGFRIPLPEGAAGVRVVQPAEKAESVGDAVMFRGQIRQAGEGEQAPTLIVRYSIRHDNVKQVAWSQVFPFDVENLSVVVPQSSQHERHPALDVALNVALCADGVTPGVMCFEELSDRAEGVQMLQGAAVRLARGGRVSAGGRMEVGTVGWPSDPHIARWATLAAILLALGFGVVMVRRAMTRGASTLDAEARLLAEREGILERVDALEQKLAEAAILEMDYAAERERIIGELALVERRLRGLLVAPAHG